MTAEICRELLAKAVADHPKGKAGVAARLGVSRSLVSRVLSAGKSAITPSAEFIALVIARLTVIEQVVCWRNHQAVDITECQKASEPAPTHNPLAMYRWRDCQQCPIRLQVQGEKA